MTYYTLWGVRKKLPFKIKFSKSFNLTCIYRGVRTCTCLLCDRERPTNNASKKEKANIFLPFIFSSNNTSSKLTFRPVETGRHLGYNVSWRAGKPFKPTWLRRLNVILRGYWPSDLINEVLIRTSMQEVARNNNYYVILRNNFIIGSSQKWLLTDCCEDHKRQFNIAILHPVSQTHLENLWKTWSNFIMKI